METMETCKDFVLLCIKNEINRYKDMKREDMDNMWVRLLTLEQFYDNIKNNK